MINPHSENHAGADECQATIGVVLAGLHEWNAIELNERVPRSLAPVVNVPLVMHTLHWLAAGGVRTVVVCANRGGHAFRRVLGDGGSLNLDILYHEDRTPRGPAGCSRDAAMLFAADRYVIAEANTIPTLNLSDLLAFHAASGACGTVAVAQRGRAAAIRGQDEDPVGVYVFDRAALLKASNRGFEDLKENLIPRLYREGERICTYRAPSAAPRVHDTASYLALNRWALRQLETDDLWQMACDRRGEAFVDRTAQVAPSARLMGRCLVARDACVGEDALIIGPAVIGRGCTIGARSVVRNSVIWDQVEVAAGAVVDSLAVARTGNVSVG